MFELMNLTPHDINYVDGDGKILTVFQKSGIVARVSQELNPEFDLNIDHIGNISFFKSSFGDVSGLPEKKDNVYYIVSSIVKSAVSDRNDLVVPVNFVRDENGNIVGCKGFSF